jgi:hypothetical protein
LTCRRPDLRFPTVLLMLPLRPEWRADVVAYSSVLTRAYWSVGDRPEAILTQDRAVALLKRGGAKCSALPTCL